MPILTADDLKKMGWVQEMFNSAIAADFDGFITTEIIAVQEAVLSGRVGSANYGSTTEPTKTYVKEAAKCLCAVELYNRRFIVLAEEVNKADGMDAFKLRRQQERYEKLADEWIAKISSGKTADDSGYSGSAVVSSHFND